MVFPSFGVLHCGSMIPDRGRWVHGAYTSRPAPGKTLSARLGGRLAHTAPSVEEPGMEFGILFTSHPNHASEPYPHHTVHARVTAAALTLPQTAAFAKPYSASPLFPRTGRCSAALGLTSCGSLK